MLEIIAKNRLNIEKEYLALLLHKPSLLSIAQVESDYLFDKKNAELLKLIQECYEKYQCINPVKILEMHPGFDIDYFIEIFDNTFYYTANWKEQLELSEKSIVDFYKEDVIKRLNNRLEKGTIKYSDFMNQMRKLDNIILIDNTSTLSEKEILDGINEERARINLNHFPILNKMLGLVQGDFLIIGAKTGAGKSSFMLNLMDDLMTGFQCVYFNMEMSKSTIYKRLVSIKADIQMDDVVNPKTQHQKEVVEKSLQELEKANLIIEHKANNIREIKTIVMKRKDKDRHTILFIDHLGLTRADDKKTLYEQATEVAKELRQMCLEYDCTIISASQLNRSAYNSDELSLSMLKDSGELENSASKIILLNRTDSKDKSLTVDMDIIIAKNRDGMCGNIAMKYDKKKQVFKELTRYDN